MGVIFIVPHCDVNKGSITILVWSFSLKAHIVWQVSLNVHMHIKVLLTFGQDFFERPRMSGGEYKTTATQVSKRETLYTINDNNAIESYR